MNERQKIGIMRHPETGERIIYGPADQYRLSSRVQDTTFHRRKTFEGRQADFTFAAQEALNEVISVLTTAQCGYLMILQCYVGYDGGRLLSGRKSAMSTSDIMDVLQLKRKRQTFYDFWAACLDHRIVYENDDGSYSVNARYHFRGTTDNRAVIRSYTAKVREAYREIKAVDLGLLYRMLPYVHYELNALCANPTERDLDKVRWFNRKELAEAIGVDEKTIERRLPRMKFGGKYIIGRFRVGDTRKYLVNPDVFYRNGDAPSPYVRSLFSV